MVETSSAIAATAGAAPNGSAVDGSAADSRWPELDGLRGLAILLVLCRHGANAVADGGENSWGARAMLNGWVGVDLFFVLSGFLIAENLLRSRDFSRASVLAYFRKRACRILPAYYAALALCLGLSAATVLPPISPGSLLAHLLLLQDYTGADILAPFWSLGGEAKFYLAAPLLAFVLVHTRRRGVWILLLGALAIGSAASRAGVFESLGPAPPYGIYHHFVRSPFHHCLEPLLAGVAVAYARTTGLLRVAKPLLLLGGLGIVVPMLVGPVMLAELDHYDAVLQPALLALGFGLCVAAAVSPGAPIRVLRSRLLRGLGLVSYSVYLIHMLFLPAALAIASSVAPGQLSPGWLAILTTTCLIGLSVPAAWAMYVVVEAPGIRYGRRRPPRDDARAHTVAVDAGSGNLQ